MATLEQIIEMYARADERLRALVSSLEEGSISRQRKEMLLQQIEEILAELTGQAGQQSALLIGDAYRAGATSAVQSITSAGVARELVNDTLKPLIHQRAAQAIMDDLFYSILEATDHMGADAKQRIEEAVRAANERSLLTGSSRRESTRQAIAELNSRGITGIVAKNGAQIPADKYMAGVIHYHQRKAHVTGTENMAVQNGYDLVYVNYVGITCEHCARKQGRVYSLSGNDKRWPHMTDEYRPPYHSHCVHSMSIWIEEYQSPEEVKRLLDISSRLDEETRSEQHIKRYKELQQKKARANETRKQWMRYKTLLPNDTPDLKTFASQKARNAKQYRELQEDYRKVNRKSGQKGILQKQVPQYKTVEDAKRALVEDIGFLEVESSLDILDKDLLIANANHLKKLEDRFGMIHESSGTIFAKSNGDAVSYVSSSPTNPSKQSLSLSPDSFRNKEQFLATRIKMVETGYSMPMALTEAELSVATVTHEYGHILQNVLIRKEMESLGWNASNPYKFLDLKKKSTNAMNKWYTDVTSRVRRQHLDEIVDIAKESNPNFDLMSSLSAYGKTNEEEFFAEVFMNSQLSRPNTLGKAMNVWLERKGLIR